MLFRKFASHHDEMVDLAESIIALAAAGTPDTLGELPGKRMALSRKVADHCTAEIAQLNREMGTMKTDPAKAALVRRYHDELLAWRGSLMECNAHWPARRIAADSANFLLVFTRLANQLKERVRWEEQVFYPAIFGVRFPR